MLLPQKNVELKITEEKPNPSCIYPTIDCILVEPDATRAAHLKNIFSAQNIAEIICITSTVAETLDYFKNEHEYRWPKLIIITATTMRGAEVLTAIRSFNVFKPHIKVIWLGQLSYYDGLMQLFKNGLSAYLGPNTAETFLRYSIPLVAYEGRYCLYFSMEDMHLCAIGYSPLEILKFDKIIGFEKLNRELSIKGRS